MRSSTTTMPPPSSTGATCTPTTTPISGGSPRATTSSRWWAASTSATPRAPWTSPPSAPRTNRTSPTSRPAHPCCGRSVLRRAAGRPHLRVVLVQRRRLRGHAGPRPLAAARPRTTPARPRAHPGHHGRHRHPVRLGADIASRLGVPLVTNDTTGHAVYPSSTNDCLRGIVETYLADGSLPVAPSPADMLDGALRSARGGRSVDEQSRARLVPRSPGRARTVRWWDGAGLDDAHPSRPHSPSRSPSRADPLPYPEPRRRGAGRSDGPGPAPPTPASGMRPRSAASSPTSRRIVTRAWAPILGISLASGLRSPRCWHCSPAVIDFDALWRSRRARAVMAPPSAAQEDRCPRWPAGLPSEAGWPTRPVVGVIAVLVAIAGTAFQAAAINRIGVDAAAGQPVTWSAGWRAGLQRRSSTVPCAAVAAAIFGSRGFGSGGCGRAPGPRGTAAGVRGRDRLRPGLRRARPVAQCATSAPHRRGRHGSAPAAWSWTRTGGRAMAVLGRWLLWTLIVSAVVQVVRASPGPGRAGRRRGRQRRRLRRPAASVDGQLAHRRPGDDCPQRAVGARGGPDLARSDGRGAVRRASHRHR